MQETIYYRKKYEAYFLFSKILVRNINFDMLYMNKTRVALYRHYTCNSTQANYKIITFLLFQCTSYFTQI
jgi:hypothetical protein